MASPERGVERAQLIQTYMVLHSQQISVRRRLSSTSSASSAPSSPSSTQSSRSSSRESSPTPAPKYNPAFSFSSYSFGHSQAPRSPREQAQRRPSVPSIPEQPDDEADHDKLWDLSRRIKSTLTDLLNCQSVKHDPRMRHWVQTRLVDAQHDIYYEKRRSLCCDSRASTRSTFTHRPRQFSI